MTFYTTRGDISFLILEIKKIDKKRKALRKEAAKVLRTNSNLIKDRQLKRKIQGGYFKNLVDSKVILALEDLYFQ